MEYLKIKADFRYIKGRLTRTLYVRKGIKLNELGCVLVTAFGGTFEHYFMFRNKTNNFLPKTFMNDIVFDNDVYMNDYSIEDLGDKFYFEYDTGDGWDFNVKVYKVTKEFDDDRFAILVDGVGQGIWEDNIGTLYDYLEGKIEDLTKEDIEKGISFPWNFNITSYADFDLPINIEEIQDCLDCVENDIEFYAMKDTDDYEYDLDDDEVEEDEEVASNDDDTASA